jgi:hypothetical protein
MDLNRIDISMRGVVEYINSFPLAKTIASCSGHGKYHATIFYRYKGAYFEYFSGQMVTPIKRRYLCFYQKDSEGRYFNRAIEEYYVRNNAKFVNGLFLKMKNGTLM